MQKIHDNDRCCRSSVVSRFYGPCIVPIFFFLKITLYLFPSLIGPIVNLFGFTGGD